MRKCLALSIFALALSTALSACRPASESTNPTCAELLASPLQAYIGQMITPKEFAESVGQAYGIPSQKISVNTQADGGWFLSWSQSGLGYGATSEDGVTVDRIGIEYETNHVTARRLLECVRSQPEWYWAAYGPNPPTTGYRYAVDLYFPALGIVATGTGSDLHGTPLPSLGVNVGMSRVFIGVPSSLSALYKQRWGRILEDERPPLRPVPWPGNWESVRFVEDRGPGW